MGLLLPVFLFPGNIGKHPKGKDKRRKGAESVKLLHLADLHIGKRVNEFSMLEDQRFILDRILDIAEDEKPDAVLIAGDVYDKTVPPGEAVEVLDEFLTALAARKTPVFLVCGNHDSPERLSFGSRILRKNGVHIASIFRGALEQVTLEDGYGPVTLSLLPFVKPATVAPFFPELKLESYEDAVRAVIEAAEISHDRRNVLVAHQFVTNGGEQPERADSETFSVGGVDNIDASVFHAFDYVALGHLHGPQMILRESVRYAGSPLKYSFSEARQRKSVTVVELARKGHTAIRQVPLVPLRDLREIKGPIDRLLDAEVIRQGNVQDYIHATLTDEEDLFDPIGRLRAVYPNIMRLDFENSRTGAPRDSKTAASGDVSKKSPLALFEEFFFSRNNAEMTEEQRDLMKDVFERIGGAET